MILPSVKKICFPNKDVGESSLSIFEEGNVPFSIKRIFTIQVEKSCKRGFHAHKECAQLLICLMGKCTVICDDGTNRQPFVLNNSAEGLIIPPTLWAEQEYEPNTILMVLTDCVYDELDYIRDYDKFLEYRKTLK